MEWRQSRNVRIKFFNILGGPWIQVINRIVNLLPFFSSLNNYKHQRWSCECWVNQYFPPDSPWYWINEISLLSSYHYLLACCIARLMIRNATFRFTGHEMKHQILPACENSSSTTIVASFGCTRPCWAPLLAVEQSEWRCWGRCNESEDENEGTHV